jgi:DNA-directed RNA polymerase specialized sigma24 family protein
VFELINWMVGDLELAEDLTHETFVQAFHAAFHTFDHDGPERTAPAKS